MRYVKSLFDWIERYAAIFILAGLAGLGALGGIVYGQQQQLGGQQQQLRREVKYNCAIVRFAIQTSEQSLAAQSRESAKLLPKINFPGLTHRQLVELTKQRQAGERVYIARFSRLADNVCHV